MVFEDNLKNFTSNSWGEKTTSGWCFKLLFTFLRVQLLQPYWERPSQLKSNVCREVAQRDFFVTPSHLNLPDHPDLEFIFETLTKWFPAVSWLWSPFFCNGRSTAKPPFGTVLNFDMFNWDAPQESGNDLKARTIDWTQDVCQICQVAYQNQYGRQIECERKFPKTDIRQDRMPGTMSEKWPQFMPCRARLSRIRESMSYSMPKYCD